MQTWRVQRKLWHFRQFWINYTDFHLIRYKQTKKSCACYTKLYCVPHRFCTHFTLSFSNCSFLTARLVNAASVTETCGVVSAVPVPDLSEQFTPPETAPPALVGLVQAIEKRGIFTHTSQDVHLSSVSLPLLSFRLRATVSLSPSASCFHASVCTCADRHSNTEVQVLSRAHAHSHSIDFIFIFLHRFSVV